MGVWEYGSMGVKNSFSNPKQATLIIVFLIRLINYGFKVSHSHTPILPYSHTFSNLPTFPESAQGPFEAARH
jgi:hypothetical protein